MPQAQCKSGEPERELPLCLPVLRLAQASPAEVASACSWVHSLLSTTSPAETCRSRQSNSRDRFTPLPVLYLKESDEVSIFVSGVQSAACRFLGERRCHFQR